MSSLKEILESHPMRNLNAIVKGIKSANMPLLSLSSKKVRYSKSDVIDHIIK